MYRFRHSSGVMEREGVGGRGDVAGEGADEVDEGGGKEG